MEEISVLQAKRYGIWSCSADTALLEAARVMVQEDISCLVVLDDDKCLAGVITRMDILLAQQQEPTSPGKPRPVGVLSDADLIYHLVNQVG